VLKQDYEARQRKKERQEKEEVQTTEELRQTAYDLKGQARSLNH